MSHRNQRKAAIADLLHLMGQRRTMMMIKVSPFFGIIDDAGQAKCPFKSYFKKSHPKKSIFRKKFCEKLLPSF